MYPFFSIAFSLFLLMDPLGNIPIYVALLKELPPKRQLLVIIRELLIALGVIILFTFLGEYLLTLLNVSPETVSISGGVILFIIALRMIFPTPKTQYLENQEREEPLIVPLAIPLVAGPSILAAVMIYSHRSPLFPLIGSICTAWFFATLLLLASPFLERILRKKGIAALERLMGFILTLIAVQMFLEGISVTFTSP
jgi:MarC family membrane protein